jgi:hypothetical protein
MSFSVDEGTTRSGSRGRVRVRRTWPAVRPAAVGRDAATFQSINAPIEAGAATLQTPKVRKPASATHRIEGASMV